MVLGRQADSPEQAKGAVPSAVARSAKSAGNRADYGSGRSTRRRVRRAPERGRARGRSAGSSGASTAGLPTAATTLDPQSVRSSVDAGFDSFEEEKASVEPRVGAGGARL